MIALSDIDDALGQRYHALSNERADHPVYAVEHGLGAEQVRVLAGRLSLRVQSRGIHRDDGLFVYLALASETGYTYEGMMPGYWPRLEALLRCPLPARDRETLTEFFEEGHRRVGLARPDDTAFARSFRHIAWPLVNALAPRQIHAGLSEALLAAAVFDPGDGAFARVVSQGCRRSGTPRLIDWSANEQRVDTVATALLGKRDKRLSAMIVERLAADALASPTVHDRLTRARAERRRKRSTESRAVPEAPPVSPDTVDAGYHVLGGLPLDIRRYATEVPLGLHSESVAVEARLQEGDVRGRTALAPGDSAVFAPVDAARLTLGYADETGTSREVSLRFDDVAPSPPLIGMRVHPAEATLTDLREGRPVLIFDLAAMPPDRPLLKRPRILRGVGVTLILRVPGVPDTVARQRLTTVPGRLSRDDPAFATIVDGLTAMTGAGRSPRHAVLEVDYGVARQTLRFSDPEPELHWVEDGERWVAVPAVHDDGTVLPVRAVAVSDPLSDAVPQDDIPWDEAKLLFVPGYSPTSAVVVSPRIRRGLGAGEEMPPHAHRRFARSGSLPGLRAEIDAWLGWSCARPVHAVAIMEAHGAARMAERATVATLCGADWLAAEARSRNTGFAHLLIDAAIADDRVKATELRAEGVRIDRNDMDALRHALSDALAARCRPLLAIPSETVLSDEAVADLDIAVDSAWEALTPVRAARGLDPVDPDTGNDPESWRSSWGKALAALERRNLSAMILPLRLAEELRETAFTIAEPVTVARTIMDHRLDQGLLARRARSMGGDDILSALALWTLPRAFAGLDWNPLARRLLEDRMTARAVRYAALRMRDTNAATEILS